MHRSVAVFVIASALALSACGSAGHKATPKQRFALEIEDRRVGRPCYHPGETVVAGHPSVRCVLRLEIRAPSAGPWLAEECRRRHGTLLAAQARCLLPIS
jgi:hypothetical protein